MEEMTSILSRGHRGRMEKGELGCRNRMGWESRVGRRCGLWGPSSWPLSSQDAPFSCKMQLDHIENQSSSLVHSVSEHRTPPCPTSSSVPGAVRRQRQEAAEWSWPYLSPTTKYLLATRHLAKWPPTQTRVRMQSSNDPLLSKWLVLFLIQVLK